MDNKFFLTLIRHGETDFNKRGVLQGQVDEPLNDTGRCQSITVGKTLSNEVFTHIFVSDLKRAKETCELVMSQNTASSNSATDSDFPKIQFDERLRERKFGNMEGKLRRELSEAARLANTVAADFTPEGGETPEEFSARAENFFRYLCKTIYKELRNIKEVPTHAAINVLVVTHGGFFRVLFNGLSKNYGCQIDRFMLSQYVMNASRTCLLVSLPAEDENELETTDNSQCRFSDEWFNGITVKCVLFNKSP